MKKLISLATVALLVPSIAAAQQKPVFEIGTYSGVSFETYEDLDGSNQTLTSMDLAQFGIYTMFFPSQFLFIQPELSFNRVSDDNDAVTQFGMLVSPGWAFTGFTTNSFYLAPSGGVFLYDLGDDAESMTDYAAGAKAGYRVVIRDALALHLEGAYYRQFPEVGEDTNLFMIRLGIGGVLNSGTVRTAGR